MASRGHDDDPLSTRELNTGPLDPRPLNREPQATKTPPPGGSRGNGTAIGRIAGIPIRLHWTFILLVAFVVVADWGAGRSAVAQDLVWIVALFAFVVAHEISHCLVARKRGAVVLGILLLPIGGMSQLQAMPEAPEDEFAVAVVGPLTSLCIGVGLLVLGLLLHAHLWPPTLFAGNWLARLGWLNVLLGAFNLLPALPMDGGRVLRALVERRRGKVQATLVASRVARYIAVLLMAIGFVYDFWFLLIGIFVLVGANAEERASLEHDSRESHRGPGGSGESNLPPNRMKQHTERHTELL